jgi:hypothetical protein
VRSRSIEGYAIVNVFDLDLRYGRVTDYEDAYYIHATVGLISPPFIIPPFISPRRTSSLPIPLPLPIPIPRIPMTVPPRTPAPPPLLVLPSLRTIASFPLDPRYVPLVSSLSVFPSVIPLPFPLAISSAVVVTVSIASPPVPVGISTTCRPLVGPSVVPPVAR